MTTATTPKLSPLDRGRKLIRQFNRARAHRESFLARTDQLMALDRMTLDKNEREHALSARVDWHDALHFRCVRAGKRLIRFVVLQTGRQVDYDNTADIDALRPIMLRVENWLVSLEWMDAEGDPGLRVQITDLGDVKTLGAAVGPNHAGILHSILDTVTESSDHDEDSADGFHLATDGYFKGPTAAYIRAWLEDNYSAMDDEEDKPVVEPYPSGA